MTNVVGLLNGDLKFCLQRHLEGQNHFQSTFWIVQVLNGKEREGERWELLAKQINTNDIQTKIKQQFGRLPEKLRLI
jgi:hypothetical protein